MRNILILFAHPAFEKSRVNIHLVDDLQDIEGVTFFDVYEHYPDMDIDVKEQQDLLNKHDIIVFHHPFFWYSTPSILKEWQDLVLEHGWAYGAEGNALKGKLFFNTITTGGRSEAYSVDGFHKVTMRQLLIPIEKTARLCKMIFLPPYVIHGSHSITPEKVRYHKVDYWELLELLHNEELDIERAVKLDYLNDYLINDRNRDKTRI